ncbi:hypothetical protein Ae201684_005867 [Aphanomyces euteiches]|uniref:Uncharacterized protein n=1 Tax=Aphanomyces euteiches TaxID=100861 RepID=A0A6G0XE15_9STRA|nr:hypothetical protein Ae201684_005867 [Aphanomyces euteiches]
MQSSLELSRRGGDKPTPSRQTQLNSVWPLEFRVFDHVCEIRTKPANGIALKQHLKTALETRFFKHDDCPHQQTLARTIRQVVIPHPRCSQRYEFAFVRQGIQEIPSDGYCARVRTDVFAHQCGSRWV